jgi:hypothetical protein
MIKRVCTHWSERAEESKVKEKRQVVHGNMLFMLPSSREFIHIAFNVHITVTQKTLPRLVQCFGKPPRKF